MNSEDSIGIIELGNLNIKCLIFRINNNIVEILSTSIEKTEGIHNDVIVNLVKASNSIRSCINTAEKKAKISLKKINVVFEQTDFLCTKFSKNKKINGSKIHKDDIEFLLKEAKRQLLLNDKKQSVIHIFNYNYIVDGKRFPEEPIGVYADSLTHEVVFVTAPKNNLKNINQAFIDCDIEVERLFSRIFALGVELLNSSELEFGSAIIDLGFEKTSLGLFKNLALVKSITVPIGINHITKDISKVCSLTGEESSNIRSNIDFSFNDNKKLFDENNYLKNAFFINSNYRKISKKLILDVIKARIDEIFDTLNKEFVIPGFNLTSGTSIFLAGETSNLINIDKYFSNLFSANVKIIETDKDLERDFAPSLGAARIIKDGWETEAIPKTGSKNIEKTGFFEKIFKTN